MASYLLFDPTKTAFFRHSTTLLQHNAAPASLPCFRLNVGNPLSGSIWNRRGRYLRKIRLGRFRHMILDASFHLDKDIPSDAVHDEVRPDALDVSRLLVIGESVCVASAAAAFLVARIDQRSQESRIVASSASPLLMLSRHSLPAWHNVFVLLALIINIFSRAYLLRGRHHVKKGRNNITHADSVLEERVQKLEEDIGSTVTIVRMLSKQIEKLSVRFRVTRQTLRDPIQEANTLAQRTSESLNILAGRAVEVEKELSAMQHALLGMQENQSKQLELISTIGKLIKHRTKDDADKKVSKDNSSKSDSYNICSKKKTGENTDLRHTKPVEIDELKQITFPDRFAESGEAKRNLSRGSTSTDERTGMPDRVDYWLNTESSNSKANWMQDSRWPTHKDLTTEGSLRNNKTITDDQ